MSKEEAKQRLEIFIKNQRRHWQMLKKGTVPESNIIKGWVESCDFALEDIALLESEPEPGELSKRLILCADLTQCPDAGIMLKEAAEEIDRLSAENKKNKFLLEHGTAALLKAKDEEIERLKVLHRQLELKHDGLAIKAERVFQLLKELNKVLKP